MSILFSGLHLTILIKALELQKHPMSPRLSGDLMELQIH